MLLFVKLFADDCVVYTTVRSPHDQELLNTNLSNIQGWCEKWEMVLNIPKCSVLRVSNKKQPLQHAYNIGEEVIEVPAVKYQRLTITSTLSWNQHTDNIFCTACKALSSIRRKLSTAPTHVKHTAHKALVRSTFEYASCLWDPYSKTNTDKLEKVQRMGVRFICNHYRRTGSTDMINILDLETLQSRRTEHKLKFLYLLYNNKMQVDKARYLTPVS